MAFTQWLRVNSEHYLLRDAQTRLSAAYGHGRPPSEGGGVRRVFWTKVFVPAYRLMPWPLRHRILQQMPGSHRKTWTVPPTRRNPAV